MLQAKYFSSYRKKGTGTLMFVYIVTGQAKELAAYLEAMMKRTGKPEAELKDENGNPLHWVNPAQRLTNGQKTDKTIVLSISRNGVVVEDTSTEVMVYNARVIEAQILEDARLLSHRKFGIGEFANGATRTQTRQQPVPMEAGEGAPADEFEAAIQNMQNEKIVKKEPEMAGEGTGTLQNE